MGDKQILDIVNLKKYFLVDGKKTTIFDNFNLKVGEGEFLAILGPNGCGKSTLLNIVSGIDKANGGKIVFGKKGKGKNKIGYVFQNYNNSLFPWLNLKENIAFPLRLKGVEKNVRMKNVNKLCRRFGFNLNLDLYPYCLSSGQQQLVAILRSLMIDPEIVLMDEPFSSLDHYTELYLLQIFSKIWKKIKTTTILVSQNVDEAIFLAQRIIVLSDKPAEILKVFKNPASYPRKIDDLGSVKFSRLKRRILKTLATQNSSFKNLSFVTN